MGTIVVQNDDRIANEVAMVGMTSDGDLLACIDGPRVSGKTKY